MARQKAKIFKSPVGRGSESPTRGARSRVAHMRQALFLDQVIFSGHNRPMEKISVAETKARLSELLDRAAAGEEIIVTRSGKPVARLGPLAERAPRPFGVARRWPEFPDDVLLSPLDDADLAAASGADTDEFGLSRRASAASLRRRRKTRSGAK